MKKTFISLMLSCSVFCLVSTGVCAAIEDPKIMPMPFLDVYCPNPKKVCAAVHGKIANPRTITNDATSMGGQTVENAEQVVETVKSGLQLVEKTKKMQKLSQTGPDIARSLQKFEVPEITDFKKGTETSVDVYKGQAKDVPTRVVDFQSKKDVEKAVTDAVVVSNPITTAERKAAEERKSAFIQQSTLDIVARTLYYKNELNKLRETLLAIQTTSGNEDTAGVHEISIQIKDANQRIQALQEKVLASRVELQALRNLKNAIPVEQEIDKDK